MSDLRRPEKHWTKRRIQSGHRATVLSTYSGLYQGVLKELLEKIMLDHGNYIIELLKSKEADKLEKPVRLEGLIFKLSDRNEAGRRKVTIKSGSYGDQKVNFRFILTDDGSLTGYDKESCGYGYFKLCKPSLTLNSNGSISESVTLTQYQEVGSEEYLNEIGMSKRFSGELYLGHQVNQKKLEGIDVLSVRLIQKKGQDATSLPEGMGPIEFAIKASAAVNEMHNEDFVHRDIKPGNFIIVDDRVFLNDFGLSQELPSDEESLKVSICGTPDYVPQKFVEGDCETKDLKSLDIYALLITIASKLDEAALESLKPLGLLHELLFKAKEIHNLQTEGRIDAELFEKQNKLFDNIKSSGYTADKVYLEFSLYEKYKETPGYLENPLYLKAQSVLFRYGLDSISKGVCVLGDPTSDDEFNSKIILEILLADRIKEELQKSDSKVNRKLKSTYLDEEGFKKHLESIICKKGEDLLDQRKILEELRRDQPVSKSMFAFASLKRLNYISAAVATRLSPM
jgi:serine/threonine protein kinase